MARQLLIFIFALSFLPSIGIAQNKARLPYKTATVKGGTASFWTDFGYTWKDCQSLESIAAAQKLMGGAQMTADKKKLSELCNNRVYMEEGTSVDLQKDKNGELIQQKVPVPEFPGESRTFYQARVSVKGITEYRWIEADRLTEPEDATLEERTAKKVVEAAAATDYRREAKRAVSAPHDPKNCKELSHSHSAEAALPRFSGELSAAVQQVYGFEMTDLKSDAEMETFACLYAKKGPKGHHAKLEQFMNAAAEAERVFGFPRSMILCKVMLESSMFFDPNKKGSYIGYGQFGTEMITDLQEYAMPGGDFYDREMAEKLAQFKRTFSNSAVRSSTVRESDDPESNVLAIALFYQWMFNNKRKNKDGVLCNGCTTGDEKSITRKDAYTMHTGFNRSPSRKTLDTVAHLSYVEMRADPGTPDQTINYYQAMDSCMGSGQFRHFRPPYDKASSQEYRDRCRACGMPECQ